MESLCCHCLESGDWEDDDKCPSCAATGHTSPWRVSGCEACNRQFYDAMDRIKASQDKRIKNLTEAFEAFWRQATKCHAGSDTYNDRTKPAFLECWLISAVNVSNVR